MITWMKQARLDQLADGIFAIVMTILVFEIRIPEFSGIVSERVLFDSLIRISPVFVSYLLSFSLLFTYWRSHHIIASVFVKNIDTHFSNLNAVFFFFVALVPFSSHFLGRYNYSKVAVIVFALNVILICVSLYKMRRYAISSETIENASFTDEENERANIHILFPAVAALLAVLISFYSSNIAIIIFTLAILFNISGRGARRMSFLFDLFR